MYTTFSEYKSMAVMTWLHLAQGIVGIITTTFIGIASIFYCLWRFLAKSISKYPNLALGAFLLVVFITWLLTFAQMRARAVGAEDRCANISWQYQDFKEKHGY